MSTPCSASVFLGFSFPLIACRHQAAGWYQSDKATQKCHRLICSTVRGADATVRLGRFSDCVVWRNSFFSYFHTSYLVIIWIEHLILRWFYNRTESLQFGDQFLSPIFSKCHGRISFLTTCFFIADCNILFSLELFFRLYIDSFFLVFAVELCHHIKKKKKKVGGGKINLRS